MVMGPVQLMAENGQSSFPFSSRFPSATTRPAAAAAADGRLRVRRCLFDGRVPGESEDFVRREAEAQIQNDSLKYNFDFKNEVPFAPAANQRYEWIQVSRVTSSIERVGELDAKQPPAAAEAAISLGENRLDVSEAQVEAEQPNNNKSSKSSNVVDNNKPAQESSNNTRVTGKMVQTILPDFMKSRKRTASASCPTSVIASKLFTEASTTASSPPVKVRRTSTTF